MRLTVVVAAICALSQAALAQTPECKSIAEPGARLACYDKGAAPVATSTAAKPLRAAPVPKPEAAKPANTVSAEDARMDARMKNICRGC